MTVRGAFVSRTRAPLGAVRWTSAAVVALFAALAVLVHHETAATAFAPTASSAVHVMPGMPGTAMMGGPSGQTMDLSSHAHDSSAVQAAEPPAVAASSAVATGDGTACSGMVTQHCASASVDVVKLVAPTGSRVPKGLDPHNSAVAGPEAAGVVGRAPPDLSLLSQLRI
ncbi:MULTISPECIES: hypothetical protein [Streptomyces]|uniref:hypothetical protein n=1 Tax=Streptomyces TaxID=1883 RepID=UPI00345F7D1E